MSMSPMKIRSSSSQPAYHFLTLPSSYRSTRSKVLSRTVFSRTFSIVLRPSRDIPACSRPLFRVFLAIPIHSVSFRCHLICPVTHPFRVSRLFPSLSSFLLVSLQISILGSNRSESGSLLSIRLHSCSATIPFSVDLRTLLSFDLMTPVFSFGL